MAKVEAPEKSFQGKVAGVQFQDGVGEVDSKDEAAVNYFLRHGYKVGRRQETEPDVDPVGIKSDVLVADPGSGDHELPNAGWKNADIEKWLGDHEIEFTKGDTKANLLALVPVETTPAPGTPEADELAKES